MTLGKKHFENILGIRENAGNQHFLLYLEHVLLYQKKKKKKLQKKCTIQTKFKLSSENAFNLDKAKFFHLV